MNDFSDTALIMVDDWHSNEFVCRFSLAWLYISTGIMISVNSTLTIDRAIAIISPFSRLKFQVMISIQCKILMTTAVLSSSTVTNIIFLLAELHLKILIEKFKKSDQNLIIV